MIILSSRSVCTPDSDQGAWYAALEGAVDVVVRDGALLGLLDGVVERGVAVRVTAAGPRGDLDVLDQLGEHLAAAGVDDGLLVLGGRPFRVAGHQ